jgi:hypothetical protein
MHDFCGEFCLEFLNNTKYSGCYFEFDKLNNYNFNENNSLNFKTKNLKSLNEYDNIISLLKKMLILNPNKRMHILELFNDVYLNN